MIIYFFRLVVIIACIVAAGCSTIQFDDGSAHISRTVFLSEQKLTRLTIKDENGKLYDVQGYTNDQTEVVKAAIEAAITAAK